LSTTSRRVFGDTSFFFALVAKQDPAHQPAVVAYEKLLRARGRVVTSDYIIDETLTLTKARIDVEKSIALLDRIEISEAIDFEEVDATRFASAKTYFRKHSDHGYSFTDCTSFIIMRELHVSAALTTDRRFREAGYEVLLPIK